MGQDFSILVLKKLQILVVLAVPHPNEILIHTVPFRSYLWALKFLPEISSESILFLSELSSDGNNSNVVLEGRLTELGMHKYFEHLNKDLEHLKKDLKQLTKDLEQLKKIIGKPKKKS